MNIKQLLAASCCAVTMLHLQTQGYAQEALDPFRRAGNPQETSRLAKPSSGPGSVGTYVGGGAPNLRRGDATYPDDGTWGWDFRGRWLPRRVELLWWHGRRTQGGVGAYRTDGPMLPQLRGDRGFESH